jgi:hypothetical protein
MLRQLAIKPGLGDVEEQHSPLLALSFGPLLSDSPVSLLDIVWQDVGASELPGDTDREPGSASRAK